jgi:ERCC4-related helicase
VGLLRDCHWKTSYTSDDRALVQEFYIPALDCSVRYHRATGYFSARALTLAARGVEGLIRNDGRMRLLVGCTLSQEEVQAIEKGENLRGTVEGRLMQMPLVATNSEQHEALELVSWMIAKGYLEVRIAIPCDLARRPCPAEGIFHDKSGIIEDKTGDRIAFTGSVNETPAGWGSQELGGNWERLTVFRDFGEGNVYVRDLEQSFAVLWADQAKHALVIDIPTALQKNLLQFLPEGDSPPQRLKPSQPEGPAAPPDEDHPEEQALDKPPAPTASELQRICWGIIRHGAQLDGGERVGEATSNITPWPHQVRSYQRLYEKWPPKMLIADEVGLGKTITAGMLLRQAWLADRAKRILILAPKALLRQWQVELREKFNLNWPIYDGHRLTWYPTRALLGRTEIKVSREEWHQQPFVVTSSQLMRRTDRAREILEQADHWDLIVLDEAHHARRKGVGGPKERGPNQLLRLMQALRTKTQGLLFLTATPMQVHPVEVWDLLNLLGLPSLWDAHEFLDFFDKAAKGNPSHEDFEWLALRFREVERLFGETPREVASRCLGGGKLSAMKVLDALRDDAQTPRKQLSTERRRAALKVMQANTPVARLVARHTRELLRRYYEAGKIETPIPTRNVVDEFVEMSTAERDLYDMVEDYISSTYNQASGAQRNAVGFVMTIYRRRLASSFRALASTLTDRHEALLTAKERLQANDEDVLDDEGADEVMDADEADELKKEALKFEERTEIRHLLGLVQQLPVDTKARVLFDKLRDLRERGYEQVMVFTQYTDTMDFLRDELLKEGSYRLLCFSGRGGEQPSRDGSWRRVSRDEVKRVFRENGADILLCTDAAAEGLNFQFCGAMVNFDLPWNPMKVEQRIGRIDRLGQKFPQICIVNLHYEHTVETDVYRALHERIDLFTRFVGKLQPILARLPREIAEATLASRSDKEQRRAALVSDIKADVDRIKQSGFDLDEIAASELDLAWPKDAPYGLKDLDQLMRTPACLPPGIEVKPLARGEYQYSMPGMKEPLRVTTNPEFYDEHPESTELWSPGSPVFPAPEDVASEEEAKKAGALQDVLSQAGG